MTDIKKIYWNISELAKMLNVPTSCIRYWEKEFKDYLKVKRGKGQIRKYTADHVEKFKRIYELERGDKIEVLRKLEKIKELEFDLRKNKLNEMVYLSEELGLYDNGISRTDTMVNVDATKIEE